MPLTVNTNLSSLNAQRNLNKTNAMLSKTLNRLSSGLRINSARDDSAGTGISTRLQAQIRGLNQAVRNANDGISYTQTAEGSMQELTNILQRMRELSVQAANDTNSDADRATIQTEIDQLYEEMDRIATSTTFNGISLLDGTAGTTSFQVGSVAGQSISINISSVKTQDLNLNGYSGLGELNGGRVSEMSAISQELRINGTVIDVSTTDSTIEAFVTAINAKTADTKVRAESYNVVKGSAGVVGTITNVEISNGGAAGSTVTVTTAGNLSEFVDNINAEVGGLTASLSTDGGLVLSNTTGQQIYVDGTLTNTGLTTGSFYGYISLTSIDNSVITIDENPLVPTADIKKFGFNASVGSAAVTGEGGDTTTTVLTNALAVGDLTINGVDVGISASNSMADKAAAINSVSTTTGVTATAVTTYTGTTGGTQDGQVQSGDLIINSVDIGTAKGSTTDDMDDLATIINQNVSGVSASIDAAGRLVLTSNSGQNIKISTKTAAIASSTGLNGGALGTFTYFGDITVTSDAGADIVIGGNNEGRAGFAEQGGSTEAVGAGLSVTTKANALNAISRIDDALDAVTTGRGVIGAVQNRLENTISNLQNVAENLSAANSRIVDADFAAETAMFTKAQILQQAGTAILAQANQLPQAALALLQ